VSGESVVTQEHTARPFPRIEARIDARFCTALVVVRSSTRPWSSHDAERVDITEHMQRTNKSIERTLELGRRLDEVLSRPIGRV
jgi:hypothetical protein